MKTLFRQLLVSCLLATIAMAFPAHAGPDQSLEIEKSAAQTNVNPGDLINYTIEPTLKKGNKALDVVISDPIPDATSFVSATDGGVYHSSGTGHWIQWDRGLLAGNTGGQVSYLIRHDDSSPLSGERVFSASVEEILALVSASASNTLPVTNDFTEATVLVQSPPTPPAVVIPVTTLSVVGLGLLILLAGLLGGFWILPGPVRADDKPGY